jgi:hypothetical protein
MAHLSNLLKKQKGESHKWISWKTFLRTSDASAAMAANTSKIITAMVITLAIGTTTSKTGRRRVRWLTGQ